jgi:hypothetical protein
MAEAAKRSRSRRGVGRLDRFTSGHLYLFICGDPNGGQRALAFVPCERGRGHLDPPGSRSMRRDTDRVRTWLSLGLISAPPWTLSS